MKLSVIATLFFFVLTSHLQAPVAVPTVVAALSAGFYAGSWLITCCYCISPRENQEFMQAAARIRRPSLPSGFELQAPRRSFTELRNSEQTLQAHQTD